MDVSWFELIFVRQWPFWAGGLIIGLLVPSMYFFLNTPLGVSTNYGSIIKMLFPKTKLKWLNTERFSDRFSWRVFFIFGMVLGAFISARLSGRPWVTAEMGVFTQTLDWSSIAYGLWFFIGGLLLGIGSRIAGGCTSGHSINGIANLNLSSIIATFFFLLFGAIAVNLIRIFLLGGM